jgi:hypothetical protein
MRFTSVVPLKSASSNLSTQFLVGLDHVYLPCTSVYEISPICRFWRAENTISYVLSNGDYGFESHPRLQLSRFNSVDYNFRFFPAIPNLGTFGNNWKKSLFQTLDDRSVPQLLLPTRVFSP